MFTFRELVLAINGLRERDTMHRDLMRRVTYIIAASGMNPGVVKKFEKLWPSGTQTGGVDEKAKKVLQTFKEIEAAKKLIDARRS